MNILRSMIYMARRFKTATALNFIGLVVAFSACYLFLTQVIYNHSYNKELTDYERLYRLEGPSMMDNNGWQTLVNRVVAEQLESLPQVESMALLEAWAPTWAFRKGDENFDMRGMKVSNNTLKTLAPRLIDGKLSWTDGDQQGFIIPASVAMSYFGTVQAVGRSMTIGDTIQVEVRGVFEDFPRNCSFRNIVYANMEDNNKDNWNNWNYHCYVRLRPQVDTTGISQTVNDALLKQLRRFMEENGNADSWASSGYDKIGRQMFRLRPVSETWFSGVDPSDKGNKAVDWILQLSCLLVIIIAAINFLNFMMAESPMRIKSINTRRVLGSTLSSLRLGLVGETVVISLAAFLIAVAVSYLLSQWPFISEMTVGSIAIADHPLLLSALCFCAILVGIIAGLYPAFYVTSFQPALALKGSFGLTPKGKQLRTALLCLQFLITCVMVVYIGILYLQSHYIYSSDYGFAKEEVLCVSAGSLYDRTETLRSELQKLTGVKDVSFSQSMIGTRDEYMSWGRGEGEHYVSFTCFPVDWHYLRTMGIEIIEGRDFNEHDGDCYIINEAARKKWDWVKMDQPLVDGHHPVVGVCRNVRFCSTRMDNSTAPMAFIIMGEHYGDWGRQLGLANIRVDAGVDKQEMRQRIMDVYKKLGVDREPTIWTYEDAFTKNTYRDEFRFIRQVLVFSVICLIITLIGVFCMTMFETEYRRKEIGIRKVMGSSTGEILIMFSRRYVWLLLSCFVIAAPLAWYIGHQWLLSFSERTPVYWWLFPLAFLAVTIVTLATAIIQSWRTANENPVNSIKTE